MIDDVNIYYVINENFYFCTSEQLVYYIKNLLY